MHTLSTRTLSALAYDRGEEYDPSQPIATDLLETLSLVEHAAPVIGEDGPYEQARRRRRERHQHPVAVSAQVVVQKRTCYVVFRGQQDGGLGGVGHESSSICEVGAAADR